MVVQDRYEMLNIISDIYSENLTIREQALEKLFEGCYDRGASSEDSHIAVFFLIERLEIETNIELLENLICKLYHLGAGGVYYDVRDKVFQTIIYERDSKNSIRHPLGIATDLYWADATTREFNKGFEIYFKLLRHNSRKIPLSQINVSGNYRNFTCVNHK